MNPRRVDAAFAAAVLHANGSTDLPGGITDTAGYAAWRHADLTAAWRWHADYTTPYGRTLIAFTNVEGGWLYLYQIRLGVMP